MAVSTQAPVLTTGYQITTDTTANATAENDIGTGARTLYGVSINNSLNTDAVYLKIYNHAAPTVGTTAPNCVIPCAGGRTVEALCQGGTAFSTAISFAVVTTAGTAGTTAPTNSVTVIITHSS